jgi:hypothetical protein
VFFLEDKSAVEGPREVGDSAGKAKEKHN